MKTWRKILTIIVAILSVGFILLGIIFLMNSNTEFGGIFIGLFCILVLGFGLPCTWALDCHDAKQKGEF